MAGCTLRKSVDESLVGKVTLDEGVSVFQVLLRLGFYLLEAVILERGVIVVIEVVEAYDPIRLFAFKESQHKVRSYETG